MDHLKLADASADEQETALRAMLADEPWMMRALEALRTSGLPDGWIVAGAIYNLVWNRLTGRPSAHGLNDIDVFYFDASDLSWEAEDAEIKRCLPLFENMPAPVQIRNQARVHLWFPDHFGFEISPIEDSRDSVRRFSGVVHCGAARLSEDGEIEIYAPHGLSDLFSFRLRPNSFYNDNAESYGKKAARVAERWPEVIIEPWD